MKKIIALWLAALMMAAQPIQAAVCVGFGQSAASSCMSGTYIFGWGGEWPSDTDRACDTSGDGTGVNGTVNGSPDISTAYGEGGADVALTADASGESIKWTDSAAGRIDLNGAQTIWLRVYISATPTGDTRFLTASYDTSSYLMIVVRNNREVVGTHRIGATAPTAYGAALTAGTWTDIAYSWDMPNLDHTINTSGTWEDDNNELSSTEGTDITEIYMGAQYGFSMGAGENIRITKFAIVDGYKATKPW